MIKSILKKSGNKKDHEKRVTFANSIEESESKEMETISLFHVMWNIRGMPKKNEFNNLEKKIQKQAILQQITEIIKQQDCVAGLTLLETNIKQDQQEFNELNRVMHNYSTQLSGDGICTQTDYSNYTKIMNKLNNNKIQIMRINIGINYITLITWHRSHEKEKAKEEAKIINVTAKELEKDKLNLGTIIQGDFNTDLKDPKKWKKLKQQIDLRLKRNINQKTRKEKYLDDFLITKKLRKACRKIETYTIENNNNPSDHTPIAIKLKLVIIKQQYNDVNKIQDAITKIKNKRIRLLLINKNNTQKAIKNLTKIIARKKAIMGKKIQLKEWIQKQQKNRIQNIKKILYEQLINKDKQDVNKILKQYLAKKLQKVQDELYRNRVKDPKQYFKIIKNIFKLNKQQEILEPGRIMYKKNGLPTFEKKEQLEIVREYFDQHYKQNQIDKKNYPKKLSKKEIDKLSNVNNYLIATDKASAQDAISGKFCERPKLLGKNKTVKAYKRYITRTKEEKEQEIEKFQKIEQKVENQKIQMNKNLKKVITEIIKNKNGKWDFCYQARQIYIPKNENRDPQTCRPITVLPTVIKLMETSILEQINQGEEQGTIMKIDHRQTGFCSNRSTTFNLLRLQQRIKQLQKQGKKPIVIFYDFKGAFDSPLHDKAWVALKQQGYSTSLLKQIFWLYGKVRINDQRIGRGFLQGEITSPRLYIQYQQQAMLEVERKIKLKTNKLLDFLAFADDLAIIAEDTLEVEEIVKQFESTMKQYGLEVNQQKTEFMITENNKNRKDKGYFIRKQIMENILKRNNLNYKQTQKFKYLGIWIEENGNIKENLQQVENKFKKYKYLLQRVAFITKNATMITNTWTTFIRAQFAYGLTLIKENKRVTTWNKYKKLYYKTLVQTLGMYRTIQGEILAEKLMIPKIEEIEIQYRKHILKQMKKLNEEQIQHYGLTKKIEEYQQQIQQQKIDINSEVQLTQQQSRHIAKQLINFEGSLKLIQNMILLNSKQKRYKCSKCQQQVDARHIMMKTKEGKQIYHMVKKYREWTLEKEITKFMKEQYTRNNLDLTLGDNQQELIYGLEKNYIQKYLISKYKYHKIQNFSVQP